MEMTWQRTDPTARLTDPARAVAPFRCGLEEAQAECNFLVLKPTLLPEGCRLTDVWLRPEQPPGRPSGLDPSEFGWPAWGNANYATLRCLVDGPGRSLRIKQFLYDYDLVPAAGIPNLWGQGPVEPFPGPEAPAFVGRDYKDRVGACISLWRTTVEVTVLEGAFAPAELAALLHGLVPAVPDVLPVFTAAHWTDLSYFRRYRLGHEAVPLGYFHYRRKLQGEPRRPCRPEDVQAALGLGVPPAPAGFRLDGTALCEAEHYQEAEVHYYDGQHRRIAALLFRPGVSLPLDRSPKHPAATYEGGYGEGVSLRELWWAPGLGVTAGAFGLPGVAKEEVYALARK